MLDQVRLIARRYAEELERNRVRVTALYVFGSQAGDSPRLDSDIDVAVVSDSLSGDWFEDMRLLHRLRRDIDLRIEPVPFRPEDFGPSQPLYHQIVEDGVQVI
ncbi:MAG: nucleotidyltransferase domain-containing protein [Phycisphaerae bacterium]|nr:nucleotidyltransferase domain-containing protein [Phycisphaerae bacterium]